MVPRSLAWKDLIKCEVETKLPTFSPGFRINMRVANGVPMLNGSPVAFREVYRSEWLVVHGLDGFIKCLSDQESHNQDPFSDGYDVAEETHSHGNYH